MPKITVTGKSGSGRGAARTPGPSTFEGMLMGGMSAGTNPFAAMSAADQQTLASSPSFQAGNFQAPAQAQLGRQIADAVRALRNGAGSSTPAIQTALQAAALLGSYGALTPELESAAGRVSALAARTGQGALVPYSQPGVPAPYFSPRAYAPPPAAISLPDASASTMARITSAGLGNDPILKMLTKLDEDEKTLIGVERERLNLERATIRPSFMPPGAAGPNPAFMPPGAMSPAAFLAGTTLYKSPIGPPLPPGAGQGTGNVEGGNAGGFVGGGGGGGRGRVPFMGIAGFPAAGNAFGRALGIGVEAEIATQFLEEALFAPQIVAGKEAQALQASAPFRKFSLQTAGIGRAGGFSGSKLASLLYPGHMNPSSVVSPLGLSPQEGTDLLSNFGIMPRSAGGAADLISVLGGSQYLPGLGNLPGVNATAANAAKYGLTSPNAEGAFSAVSQFSTVMETAIAKGMDRASILRSINAAIGAVGRSNALGATLPGLTSFMSQFSNLPGGRTGEAGLEAMSGLQGAMSQVGSNPYITTMSTVAASKYRTPAALQGLLGREGFDKIQSTPEGRKAMDLYFMSVQKNDWIAAAKWLDVLTQGNPQAQYKVLSQSQFVGAVPEELRPFAIPGLSPQEALSMSMNPGGGGGAATPTMGGFDESKMGTYTQGLKNLGKYTPEEITKILTVARMNKVSPLLLGAIPAGESNFGAADSNNPWQYKPSGNMGPVGDFDQNLMRAGRVLHDAQNYGKGDLAETMHFYSGTRGRGFAPGYIEKINNALAAEGTPNGMLTSTGNLQQTVMGGSSVSYSESSSVIPVFNHDVSVAATAVENFGNTLDRWTKAATGWLSKMGAVPGQGPLGQLPDPTSHPY